MQDPHDDLKRALRTVKRLLERAESEDAAPDEARSCCSPPLASWSFRLRNCLQHRLSKRPPRWTVGHLSQVVHRSTERASRHPLCERQSTITIRPPAAGV